MFPRPEGLITHIFLNPKCDCLLKNEIYLDQAHKDMCLTVADVCLLSQKR